MRWIGGFAASDGCRAASAGPVRRRSSPGRPRGCSSPPSYALGQGITQPAARRAVPGLRAGRARGEPRRGRAASGSRAVTAEPVPWPRFRAEGELRSERRSTRSGLRVRGDRGRRTSGRTARALPRVAAGPVAREPTATAVASPVGIRSIRTRCRRVRVADGPERGCAVFRPRMLDAGGGSTLHDGDNGASSSGPGRARRTPTGRGRVQRPRPRALALVPGTRRRVS